MISSVLQRIGGPSAVSLWAWLALAPIAILGSLFTFGPAATQEYFWLLLGAAVLSYLPSGLIFLFAYLTYLKPVKDRPSRPFAALITYATAGYVVAVTISALVDSFDIGIEYGSGIGRALLQLFWSSLIALVIDASRRYRELSIELTDSIQQTSRLADYQAQIVSELRTKLVENLKQSIVTALEQTDSKGLNRLADEVIRPLRSELDRDLALASPKTASLEPIRWRELLQRSLRHPGNLWQSALAAALAGLVATVSFFGIAAILNFLLVFILVWVNLALLRRLRVKSAWVGFLVLFAGALVGAVLGQELQAYAPAQASSLGNLNLGSWVIALFIGLQFTLERERRDKLIQMSSALEQLGWQREKLEQVVWVENRRLSKFVHSDIQGRIRAAAMRSENLSPAQLQQLRSECLAALDRAIEPMEFKEFLSQSERIWDGILRISFDTPEEIVHRLESDGFAKVAAVEVIREGLCNAVRHGKASNATLSLRVSDDRGVGMLKVSISNDGEPLDSSADSGFGSEILDEASSEWSLTNTSRGVELVAAIPLADKA